MPRVVVVADDLTGAADTGVTFSQLGMTTRVVWDVTRVPKAEVLVVSTETRESDRSDAAARLRRVAHVLATNQEIALHDPWVYKKIDSTLRGHPGTELYELMEGMGAARALVAPAFPAQGRTTLNGIHYVHGKPLGTTSFGAEVPTSDVRVRFAAGIPARAIDRIPLSVVRKSIEAVAERLASTAFQIFVADAEYDTDLLCLATAARETQTRVLCGSAGLARALARVISEEWGDEQRPDAFELPDWAGEGVMVVAASRNPVTRQQIEALDGAGVAVVRPSVEWFVEGGEAEDSVLATLRYHLTSTGVVALTTVGLPDLPGRDQLLTTRLGEVARALFDTAPPAGLVLTGGAVAIAVCHALEAEALQLAGEVQAGIPWGYVVGGVAEGMPLITKAGGFGDASALLASVRSLSGQI